MTTPRRIVSINGKPYIMGCGCNADSVIHAETDPHKLICPECGASYVAWNPVSDCEMVHRESLLALAESAVRAGRYCAPYDERDGLDLTDEQVDTIAKRTLKDWQDTR